MNHSASGSSLRKLIQESVRAAFVRVIPRSRPWSNMTSTSLVPVEGPDIKATLDCLGKNFNLDSQVVEALLKSRIQNLEEFRFLFEDEGKIEPFLAKISLGEERLVQGARLRRAWTAVSLFYKQADQDRSKVATSDLDTMLGDGELRDVKTAFWQRYRMRFPPDIHPADATLSRVSRELTKRMLCVFNVGKVKTLQYQLHTTQKKRKLADNLWMEAAEEEEEVTPRDWEGYMDRLHTLMLAYAMAGIGAVSSTGSATSDNQLGADSSAFIQVPLDITMQYYFRAKKQSSLLPHGQRLTWLEARDVEERSEWIAKFRESTRSLGAIIKEVYTARDAHWVPPATTTPSSLNKTATPLKQQAKPPGKEPNSPSQFQLGKPIQGRSVAKVMKDGTRLCQGFQHKQCKGPKNGCPNGAHRCGAVLRGERVCGAPGHGAAECRAKTRA